MNEQKAKIAAGIESLQNSISDRFEDLTKDFYKRGIFLGNPTLISRKFKDTVESVKTYVAERRSQHDKNNK